MALATDFDGTAAWHGEVDAATRQALRDVRSSGRKLLLVTGRDLADLKRAFDELELFDLIVAENGALLFDPKSKEEIALAPPPPKPLLERLRSEGVTPLSVGSSIVATWEPYDTVVLAAIRELNLEHQIIFNKGAVMILPSGVNKASGLKAALDHLDLSAHNVVAIGDAENDLAFLAACGCGVAVANALDTVKEESDIVVADHGVGVSQLCTMLIDNDLADSGIVLPRRQPLLGKARDGAASFLNPRDTVLVTGLSGSGKTTYVTALLEQIRDLDYQFLIVDPEGDYQGLRGAITVGDAERPPQWSEVEDLLIKPDVNVVLNLLAMEVDERPAALANLLPEVSKLRAKAGRPHWIIIDELHHCLPAKSVPALAALPRELPGVIGVTVHPDQVSVEFLERVSTAVGIGEGAREAISNFARAAGRDEPAAPGSREGEILIFSRDGRITTSEGVRPKERLRRHIRKYAKGELGKDKSFYFRGPSGALNLRAYNLSTFLELARGVDDATWLHHLQAHDYSRWFEEAIKDEDLSRAALEIENETAADPEASRVRIKKLLDERYTAPAEKRPAP